MTTPQSTKKKLEETREYLYATYYGLIIQEIWARGGNEMTTKEKEFCEQLTQKTWDKLLTILKETCEAALPEKKNGCSTHHSTVRPNTFCSSGECLANSNFNQAIDQTRANFNNLLGGDDE